MKAIRIGNQVIFAEHICGIEYKSFSQEDAKIVGYTSTLTIYTTDGRGISLRDESAEVVWKWAKAASIDLGVLKP